MRDKDLTPAQERKLNVTPQRVDERGDDGRDLIGRAICKDKNGNIVPWIDKDGEEIVAITSGPKK